MTTDNLSTRWDHVVFLEAGYSVNHHRCVTQSNAHTQTISVVALCVKPVSDAQTSVSITSQESARKD